MLLLLLQPHQNRRVELPTLPLLRERSQEPAQIVLSPSGLGLCALHIERRTALTHLLQHLESLLQLQLAGQHTRFLQVVLTLVGPIPALGLLL